MGTLTLVHLSLASHAGIFMGACISSLPTNTWANRKQHSFPKVSQSHLLTYLLTCTFQILESWPWLQGNPIITWSAWNTGKALWPLLNVRLRAAKVRCCQILEYSVNCITFSKGKKRRKKGNSGVMVLHYHKAMSCIKPVNTLCQKCWLVTYHTIKTMRKECCVQLTRYLWGGMKYNLL